MKLSIGYITNRGNQARFYWFLDSLSKQIGMSDRIEITVVCANVHEFDSPNLSVRTVAPKPCAYSGPEKKTSVDWWSKANSINTVFCDATQDWVAMVDDRCILKPGWLAAIKRAQHGNYMVCGAYQKRVNMDVRGGEIEREGEISGLDQRITYIQKLGSSVLFKCPGEWAYGCCYALPLEWALRVNGADERTNGMSFEDVLFGLAIQNCDYPMRFDPGMMIIEDRTPGLVGEDTPRSSKEKHAHDKTDKAHTLLREYRDNKARHSKNLFDIKKVREFWQKNKMWAEFVLPESDWFDGQLLEQLDEKGIR